MKTRSIVKWLLTVLLAVTLFAATPPARAQTQAPDPQDQGLGIGSTEDDKPKEAPRPPIARRSDSSPPLLWNLFVFVVIIALVFGANMIPSKRGHQD